MNAREQAAHFAGRMKGLGFRVYLAEAGHYGFVTDDAGRRVLSFSMHDSSLGGNYGPPSTTSGTGWRMDKSTSDLQTAADVHAALYSHPPPWCGNGWKYLATVAQHLALYGSSSKYREI